MLLFATKRLATIWTLLTVALSALIVYNTSIYFVPDAGGTDTAPAFLLEKGAIARIPLWRAAFYFHIVGACVCLVSGAPLMFTRLLRYPAVHRTLGLIYLNSVLFVAGPTALIMTPFAKGGLAGVLGFTVAGTLWWWTTFSGYRAVLRRDIPGHTRAMVRSYALATSALSFRVYQVAFFFVGMADETNYVVSIWLSLATSIWLAETCIQRQLRPRQSIAAREPKGALL